MKCSLWEIRDSAAEKAEGSEEDDRRGTQAEL